MCPISQDDLHKIFKSLDKQNNGMVSIQDLHHLLDKIGIHTTLEDIEKLVGRTSLDYIDFLCFYEAMIKAKFDEQADDLFKTFKVFDLNGDGYISCDELESVLLKLGLLEKQSEQDCGDMIRVYDKNSDGVLDFEEFKDMMSVPPSNQSEV